MAALLKILCLILNFGLILSQCPNVQKRKTGSSSCTVWGHWAVKTFDANSYIFYSLCEYTLAQFRNGLNNFKVSVGTVPTWYYKINVQHKGNTYQISKEGNQPFVNVSGTRFEIPYNGDISVEKPGDRVIVHVKDLGVELRWNMFETLEMFLDNEKGHNPTGLCGNNDGCASNDGSGPNLLPYVNTFKVDPSCNDQSADSPCRANRVSSATNLCSSLLKSRRFADCNKVLDPELFMEPCRWDYCRCGAANPTDCLCGTLDAYAKSCVSTGVKQVNWRDSQTCFKKCAENTVVMSCQPDGGQPVCGIGKPLQYGDRCEEGCYCPQNLFLTDGKCYIKSECPCHYQGQSFPPGSSVEQDCNTCVCRNGIFECETKRCYVPSIIVADPHFTTFDGKKFDFMGKCIYTLVKSYDYTIEGDFFVYIDGHWFKRNSSAPSYVKRVIIRTYGDVIELKDQQEVVVNDVVIKVFPHRVGGTYITKASSSYTLVELPNFVQIQWDGDSKLIISILTTMKGLVSGLLGTYTKDQSDDFMLPNGTIVTDPTVFGNSWRTDDACFEEPPPSGPTPCEANPGNVPTADKVCGLIKSDLFSGCKVDNIEQYYQDCRYDTCYCKDNATKCACPLIGTFADRCKEQGIMPNWRDRIPECQIKCPAGQTYQICGNACTRSCADISQRPDCQTTCIEGCNCPPGKTLNEKGECNDIIQCNCVYEGVTFPPQFTFIQDDNTHSCKNAVWIIRPATEDDKKKYPSLENLNSKCSNAFSKYTPCKSPKPKTCQNMDDYVPEYIEKCEEGCECAEGFVFDETYKECVRPNECPCLYEGRSYGEGDIVNQGNSRCICKDGVFDCAANNGQGHCDIWGTCNVKTFDGKFYDFHGACEYVLAKGRNNNLEFSVVVKTEKCSTVGATCAVSATVHVITQGQLQKRTLQRRQELPDTSDSNLFYRKDTDLFSIVEIVNAGVKIYWDRNTWVSVRVNSSWTGKISGLCGNFEENTSKSKEIKFINSWRVDPHCPAATKPKYRIPAGRVKWANEVCTVLKSKLFEVSPSIPIGKYYDYCVKDAGLCDQGGDCECYCTAVAVAAQECNNVGKPVSWRTPFRCPVMCRPNTNFKPCTSVCESNSCESIGKPCDKDECIEGCAPRSCAENLIYSDSSYTTCVPTNTCKKP